MLYGKLYPLKIFGNNIIFHKIFKHNFPLAGKWYRVGLVSDQFCKTGLVPPTPILLEIAPFIHLMLYCVELMTSSVLLFAYFAHF